MAQLSIDPVSNYYRVAQSLFGRIMLFFAAGWCGLFLGRVSLAFEEFRDLLTPWEVFGNLFGSGLGVIGEILIMVCWPLSTAMSAANASIWLFFFAMAVMAVVFVVFIYSEEPAMAWWLGLVGFTSIIHVMGDHDPNLVSWLVLLMILSGIGAAFWWALRMFHPELLESVGDLFRGRSSRPSYSSYAKRREPTREIWPAPVKGWDDPPVRKKED